MRFAPSKFPVVVLVLLMACSRNDTGPDNQSGNLLLPTTAPDLVTSVESPYPSANATMFSVLPYPYPVSTVLAFNTPYPAPVTTLPPTVTARPKSTNTPFVPPSPIPIVRTVISRERLACTHQKNFAQCSDDTLGVDFEYPRWWGGIEAVLRTGDTGFAYEYHFIGTSSDHLFPIKAGGRSTDFGEARGGMLTDFRGYGDEPFQEICDRIARFAPICREIQPNVMLTMSFPQSQYVCDPGPNTFSKPLAFIKVSMPENPLINGFVFISPFLSKQQQEFLNENLNDILGYSRETLVPTKCDEASRVEFDTKVNELIENIETGKVDTETIENIQQLEYVAASVTFHVPQ
jgi:hypothetical protein